MAGIERVLLYVGAPKTGTTSVQAFLWENRDALARQGIYSPMAGRRGIYQHLALPTLVGNQRQRRGLDRHINPGAADISVRRRKFIQTLDLELTRVRDCHTLLFYSEFMFSSNVVETRGYRQLFSRYAPRLDSVMYLRRQDQWLASLTLQARKTGARKTVDLNPGSPERFAESLRAWDSQSDHCHIRRLDPAFLHQGSLLEDFCQAIAADTASLSLVEVRANPAILQEQIELVDELNARIAALHSQVQIHYRARFIEMCIAAIGGTRIEFSREAAVAAFASFNKVNGWLQRTRDPDGPKQFFNADFDGYTDRPQNDRRYAPEQLLELLSLILGKMREQGLPAPESPGEALRPGAIDRTALIDRIISAFIALRQSELDERKIARDNAVAQKKADAAATRDETLRRSWAPPTVGLERVLLYVGAPETGMTAVQALLRDNRDALARQGIYSPMAGRPMAGRRGAERHADLATFVADPGSGKARRFLRDIEAELAEIDRYHTLLFFDEDLFASTEKETTGYRELLAPFAPRFESLVYLSRQDQWLASLTLQARKAGERQDVDLMAASPERFAQSIRAWDSQSDRCHIRRLDEAFLYRGALLEDFCAIIGANIADLSPVEVLAEPALLQEQIELLAALEIRIATRRPPTQALFRRGFTDVCTAVVGGTPVEFSRDAAIAAFDSFRNVNDWLRRRQDPEGPKYFFNTDFSGYVDEVQNNRRYTKGQLLSLSEAISEQLRQRGLPAPPAPAHASRPALIERVVSAFVPLFQSELQERREARRGRAPVAAEAPGVLAQARERELT